MYLPCSPALAWESAPHTHDQVSLALICYFLTQREHGQTAQDDQLFYREK